MGSAWVWGGGVGWGEMPAYHTTVYLTGRRSITDLSFKVKCTLVHSFGLAVLYGSLFYLLFFLPFSLPMLTVKASETHRQGKESYATPMKMPAGRTKTN